MTTVPGRLWVGGHSKGRVLDVRRTAHKQGRSPEPVRAYSESIKAAAAHAVIQPNNAKATLGTMLASRHGAQSATVPETVEAARAGVHLAAAQKIQTVRGVAGHLWTVLKDRAGEYFDQLRSDVRVSAFFRDLSARACDKIAGWAQAAADRLRQDTWGSEHGGDLPSAEALLHLGAAARA
ncbi:MULTISPECIES: hypothetical protein [unclassified Streptomyces]|uniref:hypothetical protein n=1 Tax=unclassified Streptomyces TaxID=2593676 RepID=UPI00343E649E